MPRAFWVLVMFATVLVAVDILVFRFAGDHLLTAGRILFSDGPAGAGKVIEFQRIAVQRLTTSRLEAD